MKAIINRPFSMGALVEAKAEKSPAELFAFILRAEFSGIILTGTSSIHHLQANLAAFRGANT
jgi:aryl-alcohol dehydrogenase-like predicted oxidoreductase